MEDKSNSKFMLFIENHVSQKIGRQMVERQMKSILNGKEHLKKRMIPDYSLGCRRIVRSEGFLEAFLKENVILVEGDVTFTQDGLKTTSGVCYDVDVIICATGFDMSFKQHFPIIGRGGISLDDTWEKNTEAYLAMAVPGFPNLMIGSLGPNCPASTGSFTCAVEAAQDYICKVIRKMQTENIKSIDVRPGVLREYNEHVHEWLRRRQVQIKISWHLYANYLPSVWSSGCKSVYNQGNATGKLTMQYPGSIVHWRKLLEEPRFEDYSFVHRSRNRFEFMGNGFTEAEVTGGDLSWYLNPEYIEKPLFTH
ncbi:hypothetical protein IG631_24266 [Alternaria alternata]|nr:hypothetical protein IG631_24266 [Alternaria alternata]